MQKAYLRPTKSALIFGMMAVSLFLIMGVIFFIILLKEDAVIGVVFTAFWIIFVLAIGGVYLYNYRNYDKNVEGNVAEQIVLPGKTTGDDFADKLRKLDNLKREGLITEAEFKKKRSEIMEQKW